MQVHFARCLQQNDPHDEARDIEPGIDPVPADKRVTQMGLCCDQVENRNEYEQCPCGGELLSPGRFHRTEEGMNKTSKSDEEKRVDLPACPFSNPHREQTVGPEVSCECNE